MLNIDEVLKTTGRIVYTNKGISMLPLLREDRDVMVIDACDSSELKKLDAVLFVRPYISGRGHYVLHRILRVNSDGSYWIVGDNCISGETVSPDHVIGKLSAVVRDGKTIKVTDKKYLLYVHLWCDAYPIRFFLLRCKAFIRRGAGFMKRRLNKLLSTGE